MIANLLEPAWLAVAREHLGLLEVPGKDTAPRIKRWLIELKAWWRDDETPWCGTFVAACMRQANIELPQHWYRARAWLEWGFPIAFPRVGCVVIYSRNGGGHVGFIVGQDQNHNLMTLGGNQGNRVSIAPFTRDRVLGFRWPSNPAEGPPMMIAPLPIVNSDGILSTLEA